MHDPNDPHAPPGPPAPPAGDPAAAPAPEGSTPDKEASPPAGGLIGGALATPASVAFVITALVFYGLCYYHAPGKGKNWFITLDWPTVKRFGAYDPVEAIGNGEWWRFFTTLFVCRTVLDMVIYLHLFFSLARPVERMLGSVRFCVLYLLAGAGGLALTELIFPAPSRGAGSILAVCALLGAIPGVVLARTGSLVEAVSHPESRSAAFSLGIWVLIGAMVGDGGQFLIDYRAMLLAAAVGLLLTPGLALSRRRLLAGLALVAGPALLVGATIHATSRGQVWRDGGLAPRPGYEELLRARGAGGAGVQGQPQAGSQPLPEASDEVQAALARAEELLGRYGPLPSKDGAAPGMDGFPALSARDLDRARELAAELEDLSLGANTVLGEVDPARVRLALLVGNYHAAARLADEYLDLERDPGRRMEGRALAAMAYLALPDHQKAEDYLEGALANPGLAERLPEALYFHALLLDARGARDEARAGMERFLALTEGTSEGKPWRAGMIGQARLWIRGR